jgi:hypothetical protein
VKAGMMFVSAILCIDSFFASYFVGLHSRTVDVEDPTMKPIQKPVAVETKPSVPVKEDISKKSDNGKPKKTKSKAKTKSTAATKKKH